MATDAENLPERLDNDELLREEARATLDLLRERYWDAKFADPPVGFDALFDLRRAYEDAAVEYARLEGRLLRDDILTSDLDLQRFRQLRGEMERAVETKETIKLALGFLKALVGLG